MDLNVVLVGPTGHGKSATGNTILGRDAFIFRRAGPSGVPRTCELQTSVLKNGQTINVIDTPGFFDKQSTLLGEDVKKCIDLARNRIHAILFVVSIERWFSKEDQIDAIRNLQTIFGKNIINYIILVTTFDKADALSLPLKNHDMIRLCEGRSVHFYNWIKDEVHRCQQVQNLLSQVRTVISHNGGKPFMSQVFEKLQVKSTVRDATTTLEQRPVEAQASTMNAEEISKLIQQLNKSNQELTTQRIDAVEARLRDTTTRLEQQLEAATLKEDERAEKYFKEATSELIQQITQRINEEVESRVKDMTTRLKQQLAEAEAARLKADERAQEAQKNLEEQIQKLKEVFERAESRRSETISDFESSSFHVYDPSTYLLQSAIK